LDPGCPEDDFTTPLDQFVSLLDARGQPIPTTPALKDPVKNPANRKEVWLDASCYFADPDVRRFFKEGPG
jgi:hypothetical protein